MANLFKKYIKRFFGTHESPGGNVLQNQSLDRFTFPSPVPPVPDQHMIQQNQPYGTIPFNKLARSSGWSQIQNLSQNLDIGKVQNAFRAAERGDTSLLFTYYRDMFTGTGPVAYELSKRKLAVLSEPFAILPFDKTNKDDIQAAEKIKQMILDCENWNDFLIHSMNAILYPLAVSEKIYEPIEGSEIRYKLKQVSPVDYTLICYRLPYLPQGPINIGNQPVIPNPPLIPTESGRPEDTIYDVDSYEPDLRFWSVFDNGLIDYSWSGIYAPDAARHVIYRCNLLGGIARDNFGGLGRSLLFWTIMVQQGREFFLRCMDRYGVPFVIAKCDTSQVDTVTFLENAFQMSQKLGALMVNKDCEIEIKEINMAGAADGHEKFVNFCNDQIALLINGQTLSSHAKPTGLGSGVSDLQGEVRSDIIRYDRLMLGSMLRTQIFKQYLEINGIKGNAPLIVWGGSTANESKLLSDTLAQLNKSGLEPSDSAIEIISEKLGFTLQRIGATDITSNGKIQDVDDQNDKLTKEKNNKEII